MDNGIYKSTCYTLERIKSIMLIPTNKNYHHVESTDEET